MTLAAIEVGDAAEPGQHRIGHVTVVGADGPVVDDRQRVDGDARRDGRVAHPDHPPAVAGMIADHIDDQACAAEVALQQHLGGAPHRRGQGGVPGTGARRGRHRGGERLGRGGIGEQRPVLHQGDLAGAGELDVGDLDAAGVAEQRIDHLGIGEGGPVAGLHQRVVGIVHAAGDIVQQDQREVRGRRRARGEDRQRKEGCEEGQLEAHRDSLAGSAAARDATTPLRGPASGAGAPGERLVQGPSRLNLGDFRRYLPRCHARA